jgi:AraC family transcriptional regulator of adaptative response/methylated-DNA-[protein]-cysteine methyltransferase
VALAERVCALLRAGGAEMPTLVELGSAVGVSPFHLQRTFKRVIGVSPRQYAAAQRTQRLKKGLRRAGTVTSALYAAGFGSSSRLYEQAPDLLGMTPAAYRDHGRGMRIAYTIVDSPFGRLLAAGTERGIASVAVHEDEAVLVDAMRGEYAAAEIVRDDAAAAPWAAIVLATMRDGAIPADLPLDVRVTAFQARVYAALRQIPAGETRSYSEVASAIGAPKAVRAVARACATNPTPIVVPCHRVVHKDGNVSGFRWGTDRKRALLAAERAAAAGRGTTNSKRQTAKRRAADGRQQTAEGLRR